MFGEIAEYAYKTRKFKKRTGPNNEKIEEEVLDARAFAEHPIKVLLLEQARAQLLAQTSNPLAEKCLRQIDAVLAEIKDAPVFQRAQDIGKASLTHRGLTRAA